MSNREVIIEGFGCDDKKNNRIFVYLKSIEDHEEVKIPKPNSNVRVDVTQGGFLFKDLGDGRVEIITLTQVDPKVNFLPSALLNWFTGKLYHFLNQELIKASEFKEDSVYAERVRKDPETYNRVRDIL